MRCYGQRDSFRDNKQYQGIFFRNDDARLSRIFVGAIHKTNNKTDDKLYLTP